MAGYGCLGAAAIDAVARSGLAGGVAPSARGAPTARVRHRRGGKKGLAQ